MKRVCAFACALALSSGLSFADTEISVGSVGVTAITSSLSNTIVCVSYLDLATGGDMTVSNLVKTANLTAGDKLYSYDNGTYECWELKSSTGGSLYWDKAAKQYKVGASGTSEIVSSSASIVTKAVGKGFWLVRGSNWDGNEFTFYIYGTPSSSKAITVAHGSSSAALASLTGNPTQTTQAPSISDAAAGDMIVVPVSGGLKTKTYSYQNAGPYAGKWATSSNWTVSYVDAPEITAGMGFWYISSKNATTDVTLTWN